MIVFSSCAGVIVGYITLIPTSTYIIGWLMNMSELQ